MSTSSSITVSPPVQHPRPDKINKPTKTVVFKISPTQLSRFLPKPTPKKTSKVKSTPSTVSTPIAASATAPVPASSPNADASENNTTPAPGTTDAPKKKVTVAKAGTKRGMGSLDGGPKGRGRPGPKKKPRVDDGAIEPNGKPNGGAVTNGTHKLGPKANQGAINAGLRALDRSGTPCRRWQRKPIQIKSFTGVVWELRSWRAPRPTLPNEDSHESRDVSQPSGSKANDSSTAMESEKSNAGENGAGPLKDLTPAASSPVPAALLPAVAATG